MTRFLLWLPVLSLLAPAVANGEIASDLAKVHSAATNLGVSDDAQQAWRRLASLDARQLPTLLTSMKEAEPLAENWLRMAVDAIAERRMQSGGQLPVEALTAFVNDTSQSPRARRTAFEWIAQVDPQAKPRMLAAMLNDPSMSLRHDAIAMKLAEADALQDDTQKKAAYRQLVSAVRDFKQFESISAKLKELGDEVDLPATLGFLQNWHIIGPFDHTGLKHFNTAYPPESEQRLGKAYPGKQGEVAWLSVFANAEDGMVDMIEPLGKEKEAVAYAYATFTTAGGAGEVRYESRNATKVWVNGQEVGSSEVYHSGGGFDQHRAAVKFAQGENSVLVKLCQNEQSKPWETEWSFRLRVVDQLGTPVAKQLHEGVDVPLESANPLR